MDVQLGIISALYVAPAPDNALAITACTYSAGCRMSVVGLALLASEARASDAVLSTELLRYSVDGGSPFRYPMAIASVFLSENSVSSPLLACAGTTWRPSRRRSTRTAPCCSEGPSFCSSRRTAA